MEGEVLLFPIEDPSFRVESDAHYQQLILKLAEWSIEMAEEYPDNPILVTYVV